MTVSLVDDLELRGARATDLLRRSISDVQVSLSAPGQSELTLTFRDELADGLRLAPFLQRGAELRWRDQDWQVATIRHVTGLQRVTLGCRNAVLRRLMSRTGAQTWYGLSPSSWLAAEFKAVGGTLVAEASATRMGIAREARPGERPESTWDVASSLASELGWWLFESQGVGYFGRPTWLADQGDAEEWRPGDPRFMGDGLVFSASDDAHIAGRQPASVTATLMLDDAARYRAGQGIRVVGQPGFDGLYLVTRVDLAAGSEQGTVTADAPIDPDPYRSVSIGTVGSSGLDLSVLPSTAGTPQVNRFVQLALAQLGDRYIIGAGRTDSSDPDAFDCSGLVYWCCRQMGIPMANSALGQWTWCKNRGTLISAAEATRTKGALLFRTRSNVAPGTTGHVAISLGDGRTVEARGTAWGVVIADTAGRFEDGGLVPQLAYR